MGSLAAAIFHSTGPTHEGGLVGPSSWAGLVTGGGEKEMNGLNVRRGGFQKEKKGVFLHR